MVEEVEDFQYSQDNRYIQCWRPRTKLPCQREITPWCELWNIQPPAISRLSAVIWHSVPRLHARRTENTDTKNCIKLTFAKDAHLTFTEGAILEVIAVLKLFQPNYHVRMWDGQLYPLIQVQEGEGFCGFSRDQIIRHGRQIECMQHVHTLQSIL